MKNRSSNRAGQEEGLAPAVRQSGGKPPFLTCSFSLRIAVTVGIAICACVTLTRALRGDPGKAPGPVIETAEREQDARLQAVASSALGQREGAVLIIDPQTGRLRAVVNPKVAFGSAFPPGSTMKPFTALAALRAGVITRDTRMSCRARYKREDIVDSCSHPPNLPPFTPAEALAYSCNYYFATVGERIKEEAVTSMLAEFGFGQITGVDTEGEAAGVLARGKWQPESAVGEAAFLQVTPVQLGMAYAALFNGGKLWRPSTGGHRGPPLQQVRTQLRIEEDEQKVLLEGMRQAVAVGTAEKAGLDALPSFVIGKTGTSTLLHGYRPQGWFVGLAFATNEKPGPSSARLVVVVYLKNAHGSDAAEVARAIFEEFGGKQPSSKNTTYVTVNQVSENITQKISLEDYIVRVVSTEASVEDQPEALKALAVAARTYAVKNAGRHRQQGYDFCSTTHCQRFESNEPRVTVAAAVTETEGLVLRDDREQLADSYYSASCGGMTANLKTIWNAEEPHYLRGVQDSYCHAGPHYRWTDVIASDKLLAALRSDPRTHVGETIRDVSVSKHDATGRAEVLTLVGDRRRAISGWEFKLIVGRALGWQYLKSSRFTVSRTGSEFVFRGGGFGHGLGLCQEGSHVMAQRGQSFQQILAHYFPGTKVRGNADTWRRGDGEMRRWGDGEALGRGDTALHLSSPRQRVSPSPRLRVSAPHFRLTYPQTINAREAEHVLSFLEANRADLLRRVSAAGIQVHFPNLEVVINETTGDFAGRTGMPAWAAAATKNNQIELQPLHVLKQRRILETTLRHELVHVLVHAIGGGTTPRWLTEGMAIHFAGEAKMIERYQQHKAMSVETVEQALASAKSAAEMRSAYAGAYKLVKELIQAEGETNVWKRIT